MTLAIVEFENLVSGLPRFHGKQCSLRDHARINSIFLETTSKYLPIKKVRKCSLDKPWMTDKIKTWIRNRQLCMAIQGVSKKR